MQEYVYKLFDTFKVIGAFLLSGIGYLCFPDQAYNAAAIAVGVAMLLDIFTKYLALSHEANGYRNAVRTKMIFSGTLWVKTRTKLISYLVVAILAGLAYRVTPLKDVGVFFGTVVYAVIFLREAQSVLENLMDAGADVGWLIRWSKRKQDQILDEDHMEESIDDKSNDKF